MIDEIKTYIQGLVNKPVLTGDCPCSLAGCCDKPDIYCPKHICKEEVCEQCFVSKCRRCASVCACDL